MKLSPTAPNFDHLAGVYRWLEFGAFGPYLSRRRNACLSELGHCRRALVLGDGDGRFTARLLAVNPHVRVDAVDVSAAMLRALVRRAGPQAERIRTYRANARDWQPPPATCYDVVATHFFLDCLSTEEVRCLAATLRTALAPAALWVVSEFAVPAGSFGRLVARPVVGLLYWIFGRLTGLRIDRLPDHRAALQSAGFVLLRRQASLGGLLASELWTLS